MEKITAYNVMVRDSRTGKPVYEVGKTYSSSRPEDIGYFSFENPLDLVLYQREHLYTSISEVRFMEVELSGNIGSDELGLRVGASRMTVIRELTIRELLRTCGEHIESWMEQRSEVRSEYIMGEQLFRRAEDEWLEDEKPGVDAASSLNAVVDVVPKFGRLMIGHWAYSLKNRLLKMPLVAYLRMVYSHEVRIIPKTEKTLIKSKGKDVRICANGSVDRIVSKGEEAHIAASSSVVRITSEGESATITSSGDFSLIRSTGKNASISTSGCCEWIECDSDNACISSSARFSKVSSIGHDCAIMCAGRKSIARARIGSWITLAEWSEDDKLVGMRTARVDGKVIKENVFYQLRDGQFREALQEDLDEFERVYASLPKGA